MYDAGRKIDIFPWQRTYFTDAQARVEWNHNAYANQINATVKKSFQLLLFVFRKDPQILFF